MPAVPIDRLTALGLDAREARSVARELPSCADAATVRAALDTYAESCRELAAEFAERAAKLRGAAERLGT